MAWRAVVCVIESDTASARRREKQVPLYLEQDAMRTTSREGSLTRGQPHQRTAERTLAIVAGL